MGFFQLKGIYILSMSIKSLQQEVLNSVPSVH